MSKKKWQTKWHKRWHTLSQHSSKLYHNQPIDYNKEANDWCLDDPQKHKEEQYNVEIV